MIFSSSTKATANGLGLIALATAATVLLAGFLISNDAFREMLHTLAEFSTTNRLLAAAGYVLLQALVVLLLFPGLIFTLLAGYLFGPALGTVVMVLGTLIGSCSAFLVSRLAFSGFFRRLLDRHTHMKVIAESIADDGWKTVMLTRTIPLFPFKLSNYCFGAVPVSLAQFALGTLLGVIPLTLTNVSVGALAADLDSVLQGSPSMSTGQYGVIALGIVSGVATFFLVRKRAKQRFRELEQQRPHATPAPHYRGVKG